MQGCIQSQYKKRLIHRLKIIEGQVKGLEKSIEREDYCVGVLNQSSAVQESLKSFDLLMLENHLKTHVSGQFRGKGSAQAIKELLKIFKLK